jgi:hypothetical protein
MTKKLLALGILIGAVTSTPVAAQTPLTAKDRTEIQELVASYARALGTCAAEEYADLFAPGGGYFFSSIRGEVRTRESLILLVQSERHCNPPATATAAAPRNVPTVTIEPTSDGAKGVASLGNAGTYEDTYVKTSKGWRFKARSVLTPPELTAKVSAQDFAEIRQLAGNDRGRFDDVWVETPNGKRFRSSGLTLALIPDGVKGTAVLKNDGGRYEDVYVKGANGWRFQTRAYVPPGAAK